MKGEVAKKWLGNVMKRAEATKVVDVFDHASAAGGVLLAARGGGLSAQCSPVELGGIPTELGLALTGLQIVQRSVVESAG